MKYLILFALVLVGCTKKEQPSDSSPEAVEARLLQKGQVVYMTNCTSCHNSDPHKDGPLGPSIAGSSRELVEFRVLASSYPSGYQPKRPTHVMPSFPQLKDDIDAITKFLNK